MERRGSNYRTNGLMMSRFKHQKSQMVFRTLETPVKSVNARAGFISQRTVYNVDRTRSHDHDCRAKRPE